MLRPHEGNFNSAAQRGERSHSNIRNAHVAHLPDQQEVSADHDMLTDSGQVSALFVVRCGQDPVCRCFS